MNQDIKAKWIKALKSGEYTQAEAMLRKDDGRGGVSHCCLGVLCELYCQATGAEFDALERPMRNGTADELLPKVVKEWAGLDENDPSIPETDGGYHNTLSGFNDDGMSFEDIAVLIQNHL